MQIGWISRKGKTSLRNSDAAAYGRKDHFVLAMLVDAAEKGDGQDFARHWCRVVIDAALGASQQLSLEGLVGIMRAEQQYLRQQHLHAIASYCCVLVDQQQQLLHVAHVGDCLAGIQPLGAPINWLNRPHNLQDQPIWSKSPRTAESRHLLTRSLNAKRFCAPDCLTTQLSPDARLLICSDGYWHEHLHTGVDLHCVNDDASMLRIAPGEPAIELQSDCDNFREWTQANPA
ncbi:hypothetical protein QM325_23235 [Pseudomonas putida]|nr:hypothetical protein [Pseudomonas putida]